MRGSGSETGENIVAGGVGGDFRATACCDGDIGEGCAGGVENGAFDAEAAGAILRVESGGNDEEGRESQRCKIAASTWGSVFHSALMVRAAAAGVQCRLSGKRNDNRHAGLDTRRG